MSIIDVKFKNDEASLYKHHEMKLNDFESQISKFNYEKLYGKYKMKKDESGAEKVKFPAITYVFYSYIFLNKTAPSPEHLIKQYFNTYSGAFQLDIDNNIATYKGCEYTYDSVIGRILRTYPSLISDFDFYLMLIEEGVFEQAIYSCKNDINGRDIIIKHKDKEYEVSLFVETKRSLFFKTIKNIKRHAYGDNEIQIPLDFGKARKCGDFYLYQKKDIYTIKKRFYSHMERII